MPFRVHRWLPVGLLVFVRTPLLWAQADPPKVLVVIAHPDDDAMFAATVYAFTHQLHAAVDVAVITDGSGGYRYSQLAEPLYGLELTNEAVARQYLPAIRKRELMAGGAIVGIRNYFFLDALDLQYTESIDTVLTQVWDAEDIRDRLRGVMGRGDYDFVFVHLPIVPFHGHHKAATVLALEAARRLDPAQRPIVLGSFAGSRADSASDLHYTTHPGYPITRVLPGDPFVFDRLTPLDPSGRLDHRIIVNWLIAEHKTQGTMQLLVNRGDLDRFWVFAENPPDAVERTRAVFERLR
ncbi:MAG TPA: PIG-L family deacetylase [Gemmatimonadales bacterium]